MAKVDNPGIWEKIQKNVQETERLMGQKKYNQSMIKARQTLEYMVKLKCDKAGIVESSLDHMIHELYDGQWISKSTAEHYLQILSIGKGTTAPTTPTRPTMSCPRRSTPLRTPTRLRPDRAVPRPRAVRPGAEKNSPPRAGWD